MSNPFEGIDPRCTPVGFAQLQLRLNLYRWQELVLWDLGLSDIPVALAAANGSGKTSTIAAPALLWHCLAYPGSEVVTTAGVFRQVKEQLWGQIKRFHGRLGADWEINETDLTYRPKGKAASRALGFTTEDPYKFEGWHGGDSGYLMGIFDEAKAIPDAIFDAWQRCNAKSKKRTLIMSSTGENLGYFARCFGEKSHLFGTHRVQAKDCPHLKPEETAQMIAEYGREHPLVKSAIFSEFYEVDGDKVVISWSILNECLTNPPIHFGRDKYAFIDWAAGGDECVVAVMEGNRCYEPFCWRSSDTNMSVGKAIKYLREKGVSCDNTFADGSGMGNMAMNNQMRLMGFPVMPVLNNSPARNSKRFANRGAEIWFKASEAIRNCKVILPKDKKTHSQMQARRQKPSPSGKDGLEQKDEMKERGLDSPDRADAVCGVIACSGFFNQIGNKTMEYTNEQDSFTYQQEYGADRKGMEGFYAGI